MSELFLLILGTLVLPLVALYVVRMFMHYKREERARSEGGNPDLNFVVNSFQSMVTRLKESEEELLVLRRKAEERAAEMESYTEDVLRSVTSGVITFDMEKMVVTINRAAEDIMMLSASEAVGMPCDKLFGPGRVSQMVDDVMTDPVSCRRTEVPFSRQGGNDVWIGMTVTPLRNRRGSQIGTLMVFSDLTELKLLKEQVEMREKMTVLGEMSAGIAHELRNPMGVIAGYIELLAKRLKKDSPSQEIIQAVLEEIHGMNRIITEFLAFARPTDINASPVSPEELLGSILVSFKKRFEENGVTVGSEFADNMPLIMADELLLRQAFQNLIQNAIEAMPGKDGGRIEVSARMIRPFVEVRIKDNGTGIPREKIGKIFTPFFTTKERGTGLGLALVQKIVVYHGGKVEVESQTGSGTTFLVFLPINNERKGGEA